MLTQVELRAGATVRVCWVDKPVKAGDQVTLRRDEGRVWDVTAVYAQAEPGTINRGWNNNI